MKDRETVTVTTLAELREQCRLGTRIISLGADIDGTSAEKPTMSKRESLRESILFHITIILAAPVGIVLGLVLIRFWRHL